MSGPSPGFCATTATAATAGTTTVPCGPAIVTVDNDECVGSLRSMAALYLIWRREHGGLEPCVKTFVELFVRYGCFRPRLREFFDMLVHAKQAGMVHAVVMCTAASDACGWVSFFKRVVEKWYGRPVYDFMVDGTMIRNWHMERGTPAIMETTGWFIKDMDQVRHVCGASLTTPVLMVDDRAAAIRNATVVAEVSQFVRRVPVIDLLRFHTTWWSAGHAREYSSLLREGCFDDRDMQDPFDVVALHHGLLYCAVLAAS